MPSFKNIIFIISLCLVSLCSITKEPTKTEFSEAEKKLLKARQSFSVRVYPNIITNLRVPKAQKKLKYIMLKIDLIALNEKDMIVLESHMPMILDRTTLFINKQSHNNFTTKKRIKSFKKKMVTIINKAIYPETKKNLVNEIIIQNITVE